MKKRIIVSSIRVMKELFNLMKKYNFKIEQDLSEQQGIPFKICWKYENIILWTEGTKISNLWFDNGSRTINKWNGCFVNENTIPKILEAYKSDLHCCCVCNTFLKSEDVAGIHFAGDYCKLCWDEYKKDNSRKCGLCNSPMYECCC